MRIIPTEIWRYRAGGSWERIPPPCLPPVLRTEEDWRFEVPAGWSPDFVHWGHGHARLEVYQHETTGLHMAVVCVLGFDHETVLLEQLPDLVDFLRVMLPFIYAETQLHWLDPKRAEEIE